MKCKHCKKDITKEVDEAWKITFGREVFVYQCDCGEIMEIEATTTTEFKTL